MSHFIAAFDNEGKTADRYSVYIGCDGRVDVYSMSDDPNWPQGVNQYSHTINSMAEANIAKGDKEIVFTLLPEKVQNAIHDRLKGSEQCIKT